MIINFVEPAGVRGVLILLFGLFVFRLLSQWLASKHAGDAPAKRVKVGLMSYKADYYEPPQPPARVVVVVDNDGSALRLPPPRRPGVYASAFGPRRADPVEIPSNPRWFTEERP